MQKICSSMQDMTIHVLFFCRLICRATWEHVWWYRFKSSRLLKLSSATWPICVTLNSQSRTLSWHAHFYIAALSVFVFLSLVSDSLELTDWEFLILIMDIMIKIISYVFCYRKANILRRWSNILHIFYGNKGLCHGCRSYWFWWKLALLHTAFEQLQY